MGLFGIFGNKDKGESMIPANDTERWITGTYAMWSESTGGRWGYIAGSPEKNKKEAASMRVMLRNDWEISGKAALLDMVSFLTALYEEGIECAQEEIDAAAWDLCRACQILGMGYVGGYIERQEMTDASVRVGRIMQKYYHSWGELYDSYLKGYAKLRREAGAEAEKDITAREELCRRLRDMPEGPCSVAWNLPLA